jgi:hypothetical protein
MLATAEITSLFHRYEEFSSNWCSYGEYKRVTGSSFESYSLNGGIFTTDDIRSYIQSAVVENLLHTIDHLIEDANRRTIITERLHGIDPDVLYKAVIKILQCIAEDSIAHSVEKSAFRNVPDLGIALAAAKNRDIKERVAEAVPVYRKNVPIDRPLDAIEALLEFLLRIDCLFECKASTWEFHKSNSCAFTHNALMNFAIEETAQGILAHFDNPNAPDLLESMRQASVSAINENIVFSHIAKGIGKSDSLFEGDKAFKYRDAKGREIDAVIINRNKKTLRMFEVESKQKVNETSVFSNEAKYLYDNEILQVMSVDNSFSITRILAYFGNTKILSHPEGSLTLINIQELLLRYRDLGAFLDSIAVLP